MKGIQVLDRPASQSFYAVAGRFLFVETFDRKLAGSIERLFAGWQLTPISTPERLPDIKISFTSDASLPEIPRGLSEFEVAAGGRCYTAQGEYYLQFAGLLMRLREGDPVKVSISVTAPADVELARVTSFAVCAALRRFGLFELHSGGVTVPDTGEGVLIVGPSGSGKSTLTLQLASAGWGYLSDDELLLSVVDGKVEARGFRSFFALAPDAKTNQQITQISTGATEFKTCFEPAAVFAAPAADRAIPRFVLFSAIDGASETRLRELTQAETMTRLIRACPWATYDTAVAGANLKLLSKLARQVKGFDLSAGTDLLEPEAASDILSVMFDGN